MSFNREQDIVPNTFIYTNIDFSSGTIINFKIYHISQNCGGIHADR